MIWPLAVQQTFFGHTAVRKVRSYVRLLCKQVGTLSFVDSR